MANPQGQTPANRPQHAQRVGHARAQIISHTEGYMGPTPPPQHVEVYERMLPGAAGRFLTLAEGEAAHRRSLEVAQFDEMKHWTMDFRRIASRGQLFAFIIAMSGMGAGFWLCLHGAETGGSIIGGGGLVTIILAFLRGSQPPNNPAPEK